MQFGTAHTAMTASSLTLGEVYLHYLNSGGLVDELEMDAYLHGLMRLPRGERDGVAQAINELIDDLLAGGTGGTPPRALYSGASSPGGAGRPSPSRRRLAGQRARNSFVAPTTQGWNSGPRVAPPDGVCHGDTGNRTV